MKNSKNLIYFNLLSIAILALGIMVPNIANAQSNGGFVNAYNSTIFANVYPNNGYTSYNTGPTYYYNPNPVYNPAPKIYSVNPNIINRNLNSVSVTINGDGFVPNSIVRLNGIDQITTYINSTSFRIYLSDLSKMNLNTYIVNVYNPGPGGGISNSATLYIEDNSGVSTNISNKTVAKNTTTTSSTSVAQIKKTTTAIQNESLAATALFGLSGNFWPSGLLQWILFLILILTIIYVWRKVYITEKDKEKPLKHH